MSEAIDMMLDVIDAVRGAQFSVRAEMRGRSLERPIPENERVGINPKLNAPEIDPEAVIVNNPRFATRLMAEHLQFPRRTIIGLVPQGRLVFALWTGKEGQAKAVVFQASLQCNISALHDLTGNYLDEYGLSMESENDKYYIYHTSKGFRRLQRRAARVSRDKGRLSKWTQAIDDRGIFHPGIIVEDPLNYDLATMSPINYLAATAREFLTGEKIKPIPLSVFGMAQRR